MFAQKLLLEDKVAVRAQKSYDRVQQSKSTKLRTTFKEDFLQ